MPNFSGPLGKPQGRGCRPPAPPKMVPRAKKSFKDESEQIAGERDPWASTAPPAKKTPMAKVIAPRPSGPQLTLQ
jgi:hypothetical protein